MKLKSLFFCSILIWSSVSLADPIPVAYEIGSYSTGGYSASWLHGATGCQSTSPGGFTLYMCGSPLLAITGSITGVLDGGILTIGGGVFSIGGLDYDVTGGTLGDFSTLAPGSAFEIIVSTLGNFFFEPIDMGAGLPNFFDGNEMILWGQNAAAYLCTPGDGACGRRWGIDLYGKQVAVAEPGTLTLFGIGLIAFGLSRRRAGRRAELRSMAVV